MTVRNLISSCNNVFYGATRVDLYGTHSEQLHCVAGCVDEAWSRKDVDWWRINKVKEYGLTILEMEIHVY